jgi:hypothetical protein
LAGSDVISDVSAVLEQLLTDAMSSLTGPPAPIAEIHDLNGVIPTAPPRLTMFLYDIREDPSMRNRPKVREPDGNGFQVRKPPMALCLHYLLTAWGGSRITEERMLGRVLQALYDQPILITLVPLTLEEKARVWWSIQKPYRLSLNYEVRVANLESETLIEAQAVTTRTLDSALPDRVGP